MNVVSQMSISDENLESLLGTMMFSSHEKKLTLYTIKEGYLKMFR